jgi:hypothetical protein
MRRILPALVIGMFACTTEQPSASGEPLPVAEPAKPLADPVVAPTETDYSPSPVPFDPYVVTPGGEAERVRHNFFYRDGTPDSARAMLRAFVLDEFPSLAAAAGSSDPAQQAMAAELLPQRLVYFARVAEGRPEILRVYEEVARDVPLERAGIVFKLLAHAGDDHTAAFFREFAARPENQPVAGFLGDVLRRGLGRAPEIEETARAPVTGSAQLDLRWAEFMATGDAGKLADIIAVLEWPDRMRAHLQPLLVPRKGLAALFGARSGAAELARKLVPLGLRVDPKTHAILNPEDLDLFVLTRDGRLDGGRFKAYIDALPTRPPDDVAVAAATKATAMWSLAANASEHPPVLAACEAAARNSPARLALLEILALAHERRGDLAAALRAWTAFRELSPSHLGLDERLADLELALQFAELKRTSAADATSTDLAAADAAAAARRCADVLTATAAYHVRAAYELRAEPRDDEQMLRSEWRGSFASRDRVRVWRVFWTRESAEGLVDEWIDIGADTYMHGPGMWIKTPRGFADRAVDDALLRLDRFAALLRAHPPSRGVALAGTPPWLELTYDAADLGDLTRLGIPPGPSRVSLWIDPRTLRLHRVGVAPAGAARSFELHYLFVTPERPITLDAPADALDMTNAKPTAP